MFLTPRNVCFLLKGSEQTHTVSPLPTAYAGLTRACTADGRWGQNSPVGDSEDSPCIQFRNLLCATGTPTSYNVPGTLQVGGQSREQSREVAAVRGLVFECSNPGEARSAGQLCGLSEGALSDGEHRRRARGSVWERGLQPHRDFPGRVWQSRGELQAALARHEARQEQWRQR